MSDISALCGPNVCRVVIEMSDLSKQTLLRAEQVLSLVQPPSCPEGQSLGVVANVDLSWQDSCGRRRHRMICDSRSGSIKPWSGLYVSLGKTWRSMFILEVQGEGQLCSVIFVMSYTQGCRRQERSTVAPGMGETGVSCLPLTPVPLLLSCQPSDLPWGLQIQYLRLKQSEACFAASSSGGRK